MGNPLLLNFCNTAPLSYKNQIVTIHDLAAIEHPEWFSRPFSTYYRWLLPRIAHSALRVVTVSEWSKKRILERFRIEASKVEVIPPDVNQNLIAAAHEPMNGLHEGFVLMVGNLDPRKQFHRAIESLLPLARQRGLKIVLAGSKSPSFGKVVLPADDNFIWLDAPNDGQLAWLYSNCQALVHPSSYEGFSLVPHEATAFGALLVLSDIPVHRAENLSHAIYFSAKEMASLPTAVSECISRSKPPKNHVSTAEVNGSAVQWLAMVNGILESGTMPTFRS
ncbi:MAG: glycosyltransferase family 1 protein [Cryomorphaceae bacterium]